MPNDPAGSFPMPPTDNQPTPVEPTQEPEVKLTDEVAPDLSAPPTPEPIAPEPEPTPVAPEPTYQPPVYTPPAAPMPAAPPAGGPAIATPRRGFPIVTLLLLLISIGAIAATYFFYQQSLALNIQLGEISKTLDQQKIKENQATITPQAKPDLALPDTSTISATITATLPPAGGPTVTPTIISGTGLAFTDISSVISTAQTKYPGAQLIMITATGAESPATTVFKYWFRQTLTDKKYLYVLSEPGKARSIVAQQVYVTPDNNIPSLNQKAASDGLGVDLPEAIRIAGAACPKNFDCTSSTIKAQYIDDLKVKSLLWQVIFTSPSGTRYVAQINAVTKKIIIRYF